MTSNRLGDVLRQGIVAGELDKLLMEAKKARPRPKRAGVPGRKAGNFGNQRHSLLIQSRGPQQEIGLANPYSLFFEPWCYSDVGALLLSGGSC